MPLFAAPIILHFEVCLKHYLLSSFLINNRNLAGLHSHPAGILDRPTLGWREFNDIISGLQIYPKAKLRDDYCFIAAVDHIRSRLKIPYHRHTFFHRDIGITSGS